MNREDIYEKYGDTYVRFESYYKYSFTYVGQVDEKRLVVVIGGNADDIYRCNVTTEIVKVNQLEAALHLVTLDGVEIYDDF